MSLVEPNIKRTEKVRKSIISCLMGIGNEFVQYSSELSLVGAV